MTLEERETLVKDLCARVPYGVKVEAFHYTEAQTLRCVDYKRANCILDGDDAFVHIIANGKIYIKPYLRKPSSMTKEEFKRVNEIINAVDHDGYFYVQDPSYYIGLQLQTSDIGCVTAPGLTAAFDYLYSIHIDVNNLIEKGLAIEVTEDNNPYKK